MLTKDPMGRFVRLWNSPRKRAFWQYMTFDKAKPGHQSEIPKRVRAKLKRAVKQQYGLNRTEMMDLLRGGVRGQG